MQMERNILQYDVVLNKLTYKIDIIEKVIVVTQITIFPSLVS
jgi:hypothetical protein